MRREKMEAGGALGRLLLRCCKALLSSLLLSMLVAACAGSRYIALPPTVVPDPLHLSDSRLLQNPPAHVLARFTIDAEGYIVDGPRSRPSEPVDHTALLTNAYIAESFAKVTLWTGIELEVESPRPDRQEEVSLEGRLWKYEADIGQAVVYRGGIITDELYRSLDRSMQLISTNTGFDIPILQDQRARDSLGYIFVQDQADMQDVADYFRNEGDQRLPGSDQRYFFLNMAKGFDFIIRNDLASCFLFPTFEEDGRRRSTFILFFLNIPPHQLESCAYEETVQSMGLFNDDDSLFNTLFTDSFKEYLFPTELDWMMLRILYDRRIKSGMTREEVMPIVHEILKETRAYGEQPGTRPLVLLN